MKLFTFLFILALSFVSAGQNDLSSLFYDFPLKKSRDSIYKEISKVTEISFNNSNKQSLYGYLKVPYSNEYEENAYHRSIQLSSGSIKREGSILYDQTLTIHINYLFISKLEAIEFMKSKKLKVQEITDVKLYKSNINEYGVQIGNSYKWFDLDNERSSISLNLKNVDHGTWEISLDYSKVEIENINPNKKPEYHFHDYKNDSIHHFYKIKNIPTYDSCDSVENHEEKLDCTKDKLYEMVVKNFQKKLDTESLKKGRYKMKAQFIIGPKGDIENIEVQSENKEVAETLKKVIHQLPKMIPGSYNDKNVPVRYDLYFPFTIK